MVFSFSVSIAISMAWLRSAYTRLSTCLSSHSTSSLGNVTPTLTFGIVSIHNPLLLLYIIRVYMHTLAKICKRYILAHHQYTTPKRRTKNAKKTNPCSNPQRRHQMDRKKDQRRTIPKQKPRTGIRRSGTHEKREERRITIQPRLE